MEVDHHFLLGAIHSQQEGITAADCFFHWPYTLQFYSHFVFESFAASTLYTSCAPCERCLCAIASLGVENVVFGVSYEAFSQLTPGEASPADREGLLQELGIRMKLTGPVLEDEGMHVFEWWGGDYRPLEDLIAEMAAVKKKMIRGNAALPVQLAAGEIQAF